MAKINISDDTNELESFHVEPAPIGRNSIGSLEVIKDKNLDEVDATPESDPGAEKNDRDQDDEDVGIENPILTQYIEACQAGKISVVKELIESQAVSVHDLDSDGVSGLHWASINNRLSVVKYLVGQGAQVDLAGGDLQATPLHWACRYGLVYIADFLIRDAKANPAICDNQGFNSLHLAVHSSNIMLVIYLLNFTSIPVDSVDPSKRTALHWAAYQGDTLSVDVLLKHGANVASRDTTEFTPLHWSLIRGVPEVIKSLIEHGANVHDKNNEHKDCFAIAAEMNCSSKLLSSLKECGLTKSGKPVRAVMKPKTAKIVTFLQPYVILFLAFHILSFSKDWVIPKIAAVLVVLLINHFLLMKFVIPCYVHSHNPLMRTPYLAGVFSGTAFWVLATWLTTILPSSFGTHWFYNIVFFALASVVVWTFFKAMFINPGFIPVPAKRENIQATIVELIHTRKFDSKNFCIYTFIRRPLRSKFSWYSKLNVARFDHYCPWVYNEIGVRNHKLFVTFISSLELCIILFIVLTLSYFSGLEATRVPDINGIEVEYTCSFLSDSFCKGYQQRPFVFNLTIWSCFQLIWLTFLVFVQGFQICQGLTTWETANVHKHDMDPNGNTRNLFYSSVPTEFSEEESIIGLSGQSSQQQQQQQQQQNGHEGVHNAKVPKVGCFRSWISKSSISKVLGLDLFLMTAKDAVSMKKTYASTNYGIKQNVLDFWFIKNDTIGETYSLKTLLRLPIEGEANLNGSLVDYYRLWEFPSKAYSLV